MSSRVISLVKLITTSLNLNEGLNIQDGRQSCQMIFYTKAVAVELSANLTFLKIIVN